MPQLKVDLIVDDKGSLVIKDFTGKTEQYMHTAAGSMKNLVGHLTSLTGLMAGSGIGFGITQLVKTADTYTLLDGRLQLVTESAEDFAAVQESLFELARDTRTTYEGTIDLYTRMARATEQINVSQQDLLTVTEAINKSLIISGSSSQAAEAALIQLGQGMASGTLRGEELNSVLEQAPRLAEALADGMGVTIGQLRELGKEGKITTENVVNALLSQSDAIDSEYGRMEATVGQAMTVLNNSLGRLISNTNESTSLIGQLAHAIIDVSGNIDQWADSNRALIDQKLPEYIDDLTESIKGAWDFISDNKEMFEYGLIGWALFGRNGMLVMGAYGEFKAILNDYVKTVQGQREFLLESQKLMSSHTATPQIDWSAASGSDEFLQSIMAEHGIVPLGPMAASHEAMANGADRAAESIKRETAAFVDLGNTIKELTPDKVKSPGSLSESEYGRQLAQTQRMLDELSLAAMPRHEQAVEQITRKYADWESQIIDLAGAGSLTMEQASEWVDGLGANMQAELEDLAAKNKETTAEISTFWEQGMRNIQDYSQDAFFDVMKDNYDDLGAEFEDMTLRMIANWQAAMLQMALFGEDGTGGLLSMGINAAVSGISGFFTGGTDISSPSYIDALDSFYTAHTGGVVGSPGFGDSRRTLPVSTFAHAPRFHSGLMPDEFPAILQRGEAVIPKDQVGKAPNVTVNVYNQGGDKKDVASTNVNFDVRGLVVDIFLTDMEENGPMRRAIGGGF